MTLPTEHGILGEMGRIRKPPKPSPLVARSAPIWDEAGSKTFAPGEMGEQELEIIRRLLEAQEPKDISRDMGIARQDLDTLFSQPRFQREFDLQSKLADRGIRVRMERLASEALDVVRDVMRTAVSPGNRLRAAIEVLDRSGYVKIEKRLTLTADAESIIRELNRMGTGAADGPTITPEVVPHTTNEQGENTFEDAEFAEIGSAIADAVAEGRLDLHG